MRIFVRIRMAVVSHGSDREYCKNATVARVVPSHCGAGCSPRRSLRDAELTVLGCARVNAEAGEPRGILNRKAGEEKFRLSLHQPAPDLVFFVEHYWVVDWDLRGQEPY